MSAEAKETLAFQVRQQRKVRRWNQRDLAAAAGVSVGTVSNFERGLSLPQPHHLSALLGALGIDQRGELNDDDPQNPDTSADDWFANLPADIRTALYMIGLYLERFDEDGRDERIREIVAAVLDRRL